MARDNYVFFQEFLGTVKIQHTSLLAAWTRGELCVMYSLGGNGPLPWSRNAACCLWTSLQRY